MTRPQYLLSAAAAVLAGDCPRKVSDIDPTHPALGPAVRELAEACGMPVPTAYALPVGQNADLYPPDPRENFPASEAEAEEHFAWARENGLA